MRASFKRESRSPMTSTVPTSALRIQAPWHPLLICVTREPRVSVVVTQYQLKHNSTAIFPIYEPIYSSYYTYITATNDELTIIIKEAHQLGLKVMLKPQIDLTEDPEYWRGDIGEGFTEADWDMWFDSYWAMMQPYAELCEALGVEQISISCELITASAQGDQWRELILKVRQVYSGQLTDAANWGYLNATGGEETNKTWWDAVDVIGVDAYYPLVPSNVTEPTLQIIIEGWQPVIQRLYNLSTTFNRPVVLTELGYCSGGCKREGNATAATLAKQALFYQAAFEAFIPEQSWFLGFFWWAWDTDNSFGGPNNICITPQYKPAEGVLRTYYNAENKTVPSVPSTPPVCLCTV
eukprot:TRINITY_DN10528_c0_g1_i1.p1 TRINITY_DN10528_c0_g1~~TRINITY_DN10528_c0_g1_i1.p1  ORF type:complete len:352 (-),score=65.56 TRINITY_DN10528_c0_g1_i1:120-1175(-)